MAPLLSTYLDLLRFAAALVVFLAHAHRGDLTGGLPVLWRVAERDTDAVMVFFVLSGFVIAYVSSHQERTLRSYALARFSRLWSVAIPALLLTLGLDILGRGLAPGLYTAEVASSDHPVLRFLVSAVFANELWWSSVRFGSNGPYWSLGYEAWYYAIFGAWLYLAGRLRALVVLGLCLVVGPKVLLLLPVWLVGVWAFRASWIDRLPRVAGPLLFVASLVLYGLNLRLGWTDGADAAVHALLGTPLDAVRSPWPQQVATCGFTGALTAMNVLGVRAIAHHWPDLRLPLAATIRYCAGFTFALYLFHLPMLYAGTALLQSAGLGAHRAWAPPLVTLLLIWVTGGWCERQKTPLKRQLAGLLDRWWPPAVPPLHPPR